MGHDTPIIQRLHITFGKFDALKYTGNLDTAKLWERVLRRADLPLLYTQGFNTHPRIQLASALPLGITSECEIIDVALRETISLDNLSEKLLAVSPAGLRIYRVREVHPRTPALQTLVRSAEYRLTFPDGLDRADLQARLDALLAQERIVKVKVRKRKKSVTDLRTLILHLWVDDDSGDLHMHLAAGDQGNIRPDDVLAELDLGDHFVMTHRYRLHIENYERAIQYA